MGSEAECAEPRSGNHRLSTGGWGGCQFEILDGGISSLPVGWTAPLNNIVNRRKEKPPHDHNPCPAESTIQVFFLVFRCSKPLLSGRRRDIRNVLADENFKHEGTFWMLNIYHLISAALPFSYYAFSQRPSGRPQCRGGDVLMLEIFLIPRLLPLSEAH